ncbi:hypothetical protein OKA05_25000 [Luteolibacter arcticus]|uniref:Uncharacterized protein n=1 Tax=Luteolibacter arcticus TaxID=1581411 RepID=A0ABT3GQU2_9BACT|nr:hypothetical protein [Luteolibacter arcticus]MCW1925841.1 hypothetical protein [Luteolibacter arcticus]
MKTELSEQQTQQKSSGPQATDDLTIAETLRIWKEAQAEKGEEGYSDSQHPEFTIPEERAVKFIEEFGPLHPGDYKEKVGKDWRVDFVALAD